MSHTSKFPPLKYTTATLPTDLPVGTVALDTTTNEHKSFNGSSWDAIEGGGDIGTATIVFDSTGPAYDQIAGDIPDNWKKLDSSLKGLVIGTSCTSIGDNAFDACTGIVGSLVIPDSVTTIGESAFDALWGLTGPLTIGSGVEEVGDFVFADSAFTFVNCYVTRDVLNKVKSPVISNKTIHVRSDDDTWTAGSGQTLGTTIVSTGITVIKDL